MSKLLEYLGENRMGQLATINDGKPNQRPFMFQFYKGGKVFFTTANTKSVYKELEKSPVASFIVWGSDNRWVRISGDVEFVSDLAVKEDALNREAFLKDMYKSADNPIFEVFYITNGSMTFHEFQGQVIETIEL
ncbi:MAG: pyridoxamine 5'-phosphate oxidase family protein [Tissierellales bacterium]|jgi:uncharacterized pyridoxamine 5'-phosphate oxidase family protein|nr:pyridoxamine 5'-phosphate oxidase family protein [Tissierellales bacterium]